MSYLVNQKVLWILRIAVAALFLGRAWQHIFWDAPFRTIFWDQSIMEGIVTRLTDMDWETYITSMEVNDLINRFVFSIGILYLLCFFSVLYFRQMPRLASTLLKLGSACLFLLAFLYAKEKFYSPAQFFEYTIQWSCPLFLIFAERRKKFTKTEMTMLKVAIALTFTAHGLYAMNVFPRPGIFLDMTMQILGVSQEVAIQFLNVAGMMDLVISVLIFLPFKFAKWGLGYAVMWGLATALARVVAFFEWSNALTTLHQWLYETVMRMPHFLIPLAVLMLLHHVHEKSQVTDV